MLVASSCTFTPAPLSLGLSFSFALRLRVGATASLVQRFNGSTVQQSMYVCVSGLHLEQTCYLVGSLILSSYDVHSSTRIYIHIQPLARLPLGPWPDYVSLLAPDPGGLLRGFWPSPGCSLPSPLPFLALPFASPSLPSPSPVPSPS